MPPLRVLCLHGFMQNGSVFRARTGSFRKVRAPSPALLPLFRQRPLQAFKNCEFVFPDAPHPPSEIVFKPAPSVDSGSPGIARAPSLWSTHAPHTQHLAALSHATASGSRRRRWWWWPAAGVVRMASQSGVVRELHRNRRVLAVHFAGARSRSVAQPHTHTSHVLQCERAHGPFDAVLAFSMGAVFAQIVCCARTCHASASAQPADACSPYLLPNLKFAVSVPARSCDATCHSVPGVRGVQASQRRALHTGVEGCPIISHVRPRPCGAHACNAAPVAR